MLRTLWRAVPALFVAAAGLAAAQDYPAKSITVVVPFAAGGPTDTLARNLGVVMGPLLKQQIVIDNSAGAGGTIAATKVAKAKPDGYTLLLAHIGMSTAPALYRKGRINEVLANEGDTVEAGQLLLKLEARCWKLRETRRRLRLKPPRQRL